MKKVVNQLLLLFCCSFLNAQTSGMKLASVKPKLVVGLVVDQMRNDFIYRYWERFGTGGFKRLIQQGYYYKNTHYNYIPTYTGPGHSSIYTGATPRAHGIIANDWHIKSTGTYIYCVSDTAVKSCGTKNTSGKMSPVHQLSSTIGDELKLSSNQQAKVWGIALKDRSAILPAGHAANGALWFDDESGDFISSSWYMKELPEWLKQFNEKKLCKTYLQSGWSTLFPLSTYTNSLPDDNRYEAVPNKKSNPVFPYEYSSQIEKNQWSILKATPFGNSITKDLAIECIRSEGLGKDNITDLLCISFSSPDIIGHSYGPRAVELEDVYMRLDKDLEHLLTMLDKEVGLNNYVVFLSADHGGADVPNQLIDNHIPAGYLKESKLVKELKHFLQNNYGDSTLLENISNDQVFLNTVKLKQLQLNVSDVEEQVATFLITINGIAEAYSSRWLKYEPFAPQDYRCLLQNGYNHKVSGNVAFIYQPAWMDYAEKGTTHGAGYNYDTHVPLLFYGKGIPKGASYRYTTITQIAPTLCELIQINQPNACTSEILFEIFK